MVPEPKSSLSSSPERSRIMRAVKQFDTAPERALHEALTQLGLSFEKNQRDLPGSPDIVFPKEKVAIFVHGCFWHQHQGCRLATMPKSNKEYWEKKFVANKSEDEKKERLLKRIRDGKST